MNREPLRFPPNRCFGCSETNAYGLHLAFFRSGDRIECEARLPDKFDGAAGIVHGGIQAVLLDETMCAAVVFLRGRYVVTGSLDLRYRRPCPSGMALHVVATIDSEEERFAVVHGEIRDGEGEVLTRASGRFHYTEAHEVGVG